MQHPSGTSDGLPVWYLAYWPMTIVSRAVTNVLPERELVAGAEFEIAGVMEIASQGQGLRCMRSGAGSASLVRCGLPAGGCGRRGVCFAAGTEALARHVARPDETRRESLHLFEASTNMSQLAARKGPIHLRASLQGTEETSSKRRRTQDDEDGGGDRQTRWASGTASGSPRRTFHSST